MRRKRLLAAALAVLLALPLGLTGVGSGVRAENKNNERYYYNQLSADAKGIYDAMYMMYKNDIFKTGSEEYDLVANGHLTNEQLAAYGGNQNTVLQVFGAARDAFYADYPDIFYVDFSSLSINITEKTNPGVSDNDAVVYQASLGTGRANSYFTQEFTSQDAVKLAVGEQEKRINAIVQGARQQSQSVKEQVIYVNNAIIEGTTYASATGSNEYVRTSYGALVKGESLCEGYARAVKSVLDAMGIRSVLVQGYYRAPDGSDNLHMWNYVQIDGKWYGLDATANDGMKGGTDSARYLLADKTVMGQNHRPDGVMSGAGFRFTYPQLAESSSEGGEESPDEGDQDDGSTDQGEYETVFDKSGLKVAYRDGTEFEEETGVFRISYKGMGYQEAVDKEQVYILSRFYQFMPGTGEFVAGNWGYSDPKPFTMPQLKDALIIANGNSKYIEFAITKKAPAGPLYGDGLSTEDLKNNWNFQGTEADFIVSTGKLLNPRGNFVPSPFASKVTPGNTGYITCGRKYHIKAEFNEQLETYDGKEVGYELTVSDGWSALENSKVENVKWDGNRTVEFDFTPSLMLADNCAGYQFQITGLRGKGSQKVPDSFSYYAKKRIPICTYRPQGIDLTLGAKPILLEPGDLSYNGWMTSDGRKLVDVVDRIKLVASKPQLEAEKPTAQQTAQMLQQIEGQLDQNVSITASATYELRLMHCNHNVIQTGNSVRLMVGFPEGFSPQNEGVTYKAYHFRKGADGRLIAEEISCVATEYGLIITCNSFSPFAIVEVKDPGDVVPETQKLLVMNSAGGDVEILGAKGDMICEINAPKESKTIAIKAKDGYSISRINLTDKGDRQITNNKSMNLTIRSEDLPGRNNVLEVTFAQDKPKQETTPAAPAQTVPSGDTNNAAAQQNGTSVQNGQSGGSGSNGQSGSSGNSAGSSTGNTAGTASGSKQTASAADKTPAGQAPQEQAKAPAQEKAPAVERSDSGTSGSGAGTGDSTGGAETGEAGADGQEDGIPEEAVTTTTQSNEQLASSPLGDTGMQEITDADIAGRKSGISGLLWTILISVAGAGIIVGAIAGYVRMKRKWSE